MGAWVEGERLAQHNRRAGTLTHNAPALTSGGIAPQATRIVAHATRRTKQAGFLFGGDIMEWVFVVLAVALVWSWLLGGSDVSKPQ